MSELVWRKSSFSGTDAEKNRLEVAVESRGLVFFRESDDPGVVARAGRATRGAFVAGVGAGAYDRFEEDTRA